MPRSRRLVIAALFVAGCAWAAPAPAAKGPPSAKIQQAIEELGSERFAVRERASKFLWEAGAAAEDALRAAVKSKDEETSNRAKAILEKFDWGLYPDTPAEVVKVIEKFRGGDVATRQEAVGELMRLKPTRFATLRKLIAQEQDDNARQQMYQTMAFQARRAVPGLIVANHLDEASELLEICVAPANPASMGDYAAFQFLRNRVPETVRRFESLRQRGSEAEARRAAETLAYLYRVQKDWPAARAAAEQAKNKELENDVAWEANDWQTLSKAKELAEFRDGEFRGEQASYYRLAGNKAKYDELIAELRKELAGVEGDDASAFTLAHALLLNGQGADAISVLKERPKRQPELVFDLLCAQLKFREAFALADQAAKELEKDEETAFRRDELDMQRGKVLAGLGDRDAATQVFRGVLDRSMGGDRFRIGNRTSINVVKAIARAGMRDLAAECAARALAHHDKENVGALAVAFLDPILDDKKFAAQVWWYAFRRAKPDEDPAAVMTRIMAIADGKADRKKADELAGLIETSRKEPKIDDGTRSTIVIGGLATGGAIADYAIAEAYRLTGIKDKAEEHYKKAVDHKADPGDPAIADILDDWLDDDAPAPLPPKYRFLLAYADFLFAQKKPKDAAAQYRKAWELAPFQPLTLFMTGFALSKAGDDAEGKRLMSLAHWVPMGDEGARTRFAEDLMRRGFDADSRRETDLIMSTAWFRSFHVGNAFLRVARLKVRQKDFATAALYYEKDVISLFRTGAHFIEPKAYLTVPELSRTYRARALFAAGKIDEAIAEVRAGLAVLPGNVDVAIGFVPDLDRAGKKKEADEIYGKVKTAFESALKDYGSSPDLRNSIAWTMVNCNRDLDDALKHAQKAVEQAPRTAGYIDTLAEVYFRKKDRVKALELMKQCAALEPTNPYFRKQLDRFENKPFDSPLPDEETGDD